MSFESIFQGEKVAMQGSGQWWLAGGILSGNCVAAYQAKGAVDLTTSYINLANVGTNNAKQYGAPTFDSAYGWSFDGDDDYLEAGSISPASDYTIICRFSDNFGVQPKIGIGGMYQNSVIRMNFFKTATTAYFQRAETQKTLAHSDSFGVYCIAGSSYYINGNLIGNDLGTSYTGQTKLVRIGWVEYNYTGLIKIQAFAIYNIPISETQVSMLTSAMNTL